MTPLGEKIAALIARNGPITVADYMALCLGDPEHGYYMAREPFGRGGDFVTAPEVSQMFGELIGLWAVATWEAMGAPARLVLAELGPGRGTLMADLLRAARIRPAFIAAAGVHLVESSPRLRAVQERTLAGHAVSWHGQIDTLPPGPSIVIANEFFDALPIRQYVVGEGGWAERMVGLGDDGRLAIGLRTIEAPGPGLSGEGRETGATVEVSPASTAIMAALAGRVSRDGGAVLAMDYGYERPAFGDTLQAVRAHAFADPLAEPGEADLTAHVDFGAMARAAADAGAVAWPLLTQGAFLARLGIAERAARLAKGQDEAGVAALRAAVERLAGPDAMGTLFKVLGVAQSGLALPAFDGDAEPERA